MGGINIIIPIPKTAMSEEELHKVLQPENMVHPRKKIGE